MRQCSYAKNMLIFSKMLLVVVKQKNLAQSVKKNSISKEQYCQKSLAIMDEAIECINDSITTIKEIHRAHFETKANLIQAQIIIATPPIPKYKSGSVKGIVPVLSQDKLEWVQMPIDIKDLSIIAPCPLKNPTVIAPCDLIQKG
jgi:hypothetical protein